MKRVRLNDKNYISNLLEFYSLYFKRIKYAILVPFLIFYVNKNSVQKTVKFTGETVYLRYT